MSRVLNEVTAPDAASPLCLSSRRQGRGPGELSLLKGIRL